MKYREVSGGKGIKVWGDAEDGALAQADDLARLPFVISHVALMPDAHQGYGMPIGGVLFADNAVVPYAIGVDIGCGVILGRTDLSVKECDVKTVAQQVLRDVPVGNGPGGNLREPMSEDDALDRMGCDGVAEPVMGTSGGTARSDPAAKPLGVPVLVSTARVETRTARTTAKATNWLDGDKRCTRPDPLEWQAA